MNKTYIANENHPYLKVGVKVDEEGVVTDWVGMTVVKPVNQQDWYDEVKWKPNEMEKYFRLDSISDIDRAYWTNSFIDQERYKIGNCYKTREEAEQARERVLKAYKGE